MKRILFLSIFICCILSSCTVSSSISEDTITTQGYGQIKIIVANNSSRKAMDLDWIQSQVSKYKLELYNASERYSETFTVSDSKSFTVKEGSYNAVLIATDYTNSWSFGSGSVKNIVVTEGNQTNVDFILKPYNYSISCPDEVNCSESFDVECFFDTRNELIKIWNGSITARIKSNNSCISSGKTSHNSSVIGICNLTAPSTSTETYIYMSGIELRIVDSTFNKYIDIPSPYLPETNDLFKNVSWTPINFIEPESSTGVNITISWEQ